MGPCVRRGCCGRAAWPFGTSSASQPSSTPRSGAPGSWRSWPSLPGWWPMTGRSSPSGPPPPSTTSGSSCPVPAGGRCWPGPGWPPPGLPIWSAPRPRAARHRQRPRPGGPLAARRAGCAATSSPSWRTRARAWRPAARPWWRRCGGGDPCATVQPRRGGRGDAGGGRVARRHRSRRPVPAGPPLVAGEDVDAVAATMPSQLPEPVDHVLVQADLTAIAPGPLAGRPRPAHAADRRRRVARRRHGLPVHARLRAAPSTPGGRPTSCSTPSRRQPHRGPPAPRVPRPRRRPAPRPDPRRGRDRIHPQRRRVRPRGAARRPRAWRRCGCGASPRPCSSPPPTPRRCSS